MHVAVVNLDFTRRGDRALVREAIRGVQLVGAVEARRKNGQPVDLAGMVPRPWRVLHDTRNTGTSGLAILYDASAVTVHSWKWHRTSNLPGLNKRGTLIADVSNDGRRAHVAVSHFPPPRIPGGRRLHARALRRLLARHRHVLFLGDVNMKPPSKVGDLLGLDADGFEVMALAWSTRITVTRVRRRKAAGTDHPIITAQVTLPKEKAMTYREARSLQTLKAEIDKAAPARSVRSDGWIGDAAHAVRTSDHNPWVKDSRGVGVVRARDFTHDPANKMDGHKLAAHLERMLRAGTHPALGSGAYVIWNRRIISRDRISEGWRVYTGSNPHTAHVHVSVTTEPGYDSTAPWGWAATQPPPQPKPTRPKDVRDVLATMRANRKAAKKAGKKVRQRRWGKAIRHLKSLFPVR